MIDWKRLRVTTPDRAFVNQQKISKEQGHLTDDEAALIANHVITHGKTSGRAINPQGGSITDYIYAINSIRKRTGLGLADSKQRADVFREYLETTFSNEDIQESFKKLIHNARGKDLLK